MLIIAHRQNTYEELLLAKELGLDAAEVDVRHCLFNNCNKLVLAHDPVYTRVEHENLVELRNVLQFGEWMDLHLEIKDEVLAKEILQMVSNLRHRDHIIYSSFKWLELLKIRFLNPRARIGLLWSGEREKIPKCLVALAGKSTGAESIHLDFEMIRKNPSLVMYFRKKSFLVYSYTVNEIDDIVLARNYSLDGIFTDRPMYAKEVLEKNAYSN